MKAFFALLIVFISACLTFGVTKANGADMKDIFDYYAKGSAGTFDTNGMRHWSGPSFTGRNALNEPTLFQLPNISMGGSCKGIDFHASGFGLVTKDEIVQMARGIAQGAPGYFFNLAIGAVCSSCLQGINEFMAKLEKFNDITKGSCERFWDMASSPFATDKEKVNANAESKGNLEDTITGTLTSWGDTLDQWYNPSEPGKALGNATTASVEKVLNENVVYERIKESFTNRYTLNADAGALSTPELVMSLFGTYIVSAIPNATEDVKMDGLNPAKNLTPYSLVFGSTEKVHFWRCDGSVSDNNNKCLQPVEQQDTDFEGLYIKFHKVLIGDIDVGNGGIITKIYQRQNLTTTELEFVKAFSIPYIKIAKLKSNRQRMDFARYFALALAQEHVNKIFLESSNTLKIALRKEHKGKTVDFTQKIHGYIAEAETALEQMNISVEKKKDEITKSFALYSSVESLQSKNSLGVL